MKTNVQRTWIVRRCAVAMLSVCVVADFTMITCADAQTNTATITGTVTDTTGAVIPGATVTATNTGTGITQSQVTDGNGRYTIVQLMPGFYDVQTAKVGFASELRKRQELLVGTTITMNFSLGVSTTESVVVTTAVPLIESTQSTISRVIQTSEIDNLPLFNRNFANLAALSPGAYLNTTGAVNTSGINLYFGGSGAGSNAYIVDGSSITKMNHGGVIVNFAQDWIQEFSVVTQQASAEYGLSSSGTLNAITRSGGNTVHGRIYGYFQNAALNATPSFLPSSSPNKPPYHQERVGATLGGPIRKDRLFYFVGYEWLDNYTSVGVSIPAAFISPIASSGVFPSTQNTSTAIAKIDYNINQANSIHLRANSEYDILGNVGIGPSGSTIVTLGSALTERQDGQIFNGIWDDIISSTVLNEVRASFYSTNLNARCNAQIILGPYTGGGENETPYGNPTGYYATINYNSAGVTVGCSTNALGGSGERDYLANDTLSVSKGSHDIKVGIDFGYRRFFNQDVNKLANGSYTIPGQTPFDEETSTISTYPTAYQINWASTLLSNSVPAPRFGLFAQDSWKMRSNFTMNMGIRYDLDFSNSMTDTLPALNPIHNDTTNVSPRIGFAWTPEHNNNTVIRGGFGVYYDQTHADALGQYYLTDIGPQITDNFNYNSATLNPYCYGNSSCATSVPAAYENAVREVLAYALANYTLPNFNPPGGVITVGPNEYVIPPLTTTLPRAVNNIPEDFKNPGTLQATTGIERQIGNSFGGSADFVYTRGFNELVLYNSNISKVTYQPINPEFSSITQYSNGGYFNGYSLQIQAHYQDRRADALRVAYTLGFAHDNTPNSASGGGFVLGSTGTTLATDPFDFNVDYGPSTHIPRHVLNISGLVNIPWGLRFSPIIGLQSGMPFTATTTARTTGCPVYYNQCYPVGYSKGSLTGATTFSFDSRLAKTFSIRKRYFATLMFEGYNITNRTNVGSNYQTNVASPTFLQPTGAGPKRQLQAGFEFDF